MSKNIVIVGATGAVGVEMIRCLEELNFPVGRLRLVASEKSVGKKVKTKFGVVEVEAISEEVFEGSDFALFSAGSGVSKEWRERVGGKDGGEWASPIMIDNSSAFRYEAETPLVIPGVNSEAAFKHRGVISNPNCTTAIAAMALWPLHREFGLRKVIISTYQATSGAGAKAMQELIDQTREVLSRTNDPMQLTKERVQSRNFAHQIAFNLIPHIDSFQENGYTKEEMKVAWETRKIFGEPDLAVSCTAVRIPTLRAHSESIVIETEKVISVEAARRILGAAPGVDVVDDVAGNRYPMPLNASDKFNVEVGRLRQSLIFGEHGLEFFVSGDQLLRGAALNAVEIARLFV